MRFINQIIREPMSGIPLTSPMTLKGEEAWLEATLGQIRKRSMVLLVLEIDGRIVGSCSVQRRMWKEKHRAQIGIVINKCARGRGIGEIMMRTTITLARKRMSGLELIDLVTYSYNSRALALYKKSGFKRVGCLPHAVKENCRYYDDIFMVLHLDDLIKKG
ncbi:MAG: GNAT family N-acetyltransferase [Thermoplasmata archaeon]|nr:GNAT family N-acetyltransferase [Thermoplasmata archaeon]